VRWCAPRNGIGARCVVDTDFHQRSREARVKSRSQTFDEHRAMPKLRVQCFAISLDGYGAGPAQDLKNPLGIGGEDLHTWAVTTREFQKMHGNGGDGDVGINNDFIARGFENIGAWILGRNMFGPIRGDWSDEEWKGWWGTTPPYHCDVFVLTHHPRRSFTMDGGTTFHFVTDGIESARRRAFEAAKGKDVRLGGGVSTIRQYLEARLVDEMHIAVAPVILGGGEHLFFGLDLLALGYDCTQHVATPTVSHFVVVKK
jgi:dihydrofolate reductase